MPAGVGPDVEPGQVGDVGRDGFASCSWAGPASPSYTATNTSYGSIHRDDDDGRVVVRRQLLPALVWPEAIEVVQVLADHGQGVSFVVDQQTAGALLAQAAAQR